LQKNLAARMGRWSAAHRKLAIGGWLAFVVLSFVIGGMVGVKQPADDSDRVGDSGRAMALVDDHFPTQNTESVIVQARPGGHATDPAVRAAVAQTMAAVSGDGHVYDVRSPYTHADQVSKDGRSVLVNF
jgi:RND superfamily putative drug exporter